MPFEVRLGHQRPAARVHDRALDLLLVELLQPRVLVAVLGLHRLVEPLGVGGLTRGALLQHLDQRAGNVGLVEVGLQRGDDPVVGQQHLASRRVMIG